METLYAQALWHVIEKGRSPKEAVSSLADVLKKQGRIELLPRIKRALVRLAARENAKRAKIYVAHEKDAKHALHASGAHDAEVRIDANLIGGWRLESADGLVDKSFKKQLLDIYNSVVEK